jgi:hypothetical protein
VASVEAKCFSPNQEKLVHRKVHLLGVAPNSRIKSIKELIWESFVPTSKPVSKSFLCCWESKSKGLDPKHKSEKNERMERVREQKERRREGRNTKVQEHVNSIKNARSSPRGDHKGDLFTGWLGVGKQCPNSP